MQWHAQLIFPVRGIFFLLVFILSAQVTHAQYFSTGQEPASIRWRQIKSEHTRLIYPDYYEQQARKLLTYMDSTYVYVGNSLDYHPKPVSLIMHTQSAKSNALVAWAPKRMEFYTTPPQDMYAQPWLEQLAQHEYRHVVQIEKLNQSATKVISWIFGQQGTAAILGLYVPFWFLEGDAVVSETGLSYSGRGRDPLFEMRLRTQILERGRYSYDKAVLGSYRDFIPNHYELGYFLVAEGRRKYGIDLWIHALNRVAKRPYMITPFQKGIKDISGQRKVPFYKESLSSLQERWHVQDSVTKTEPLAQLSPQQKHYTDYRHPAFIADNELIALKSGIDDISRFVRISENGEEEAIFTPGFINPETVSYAAGQICWTERRPDLRWQNRSTTVIRIYNIETGKARTLNNGLRLFAPALNDDATKIVTVHVDSLDQYALIILDAFTGNIEQRMPTPENVFPLTPVWAGDDLIICVLVSEDGKTLAKFDPASGRYKTFLNWEFTEISQPVFHAPYIYFTGSWSGISNIYALSKQDAEIHQVSFSRYGAVDAHISDDGSSLAFADYSPDGYRIVKIPMENEKWKLLSEVRDQSIGLYRSIAPQETIVPAWSEVPASEAPSKKYSRIGNLFNFHSWAPVDINASTYDIHPGVSIMSQNLLSSSFLTAGYSYDLSEEAGKIYGKYSYAGWYPIIDLSADYGLRRDYAYTTEKIEVKWHETNLMAGLRLPLTLSRCKNFAGLSASVYTNQILRRMIEGNGLKFKDPDIFSMRYGLSMFRQIKSSMRDIFPRWGQSLGMYYRDTPGVTEQYSYIAAATMSLYFPGIIRHHGLNIYTGYQYREIGNYKFGDIVAYPRGVSGMQDEGLLSIRGTYAFPIAYPDWSIGPVLYMKRIRANLFYDYAFSWNKGKQGTYNSFGADLLTEVHVLRFIAPFEFGVRYAYLPDDASSYWSFLFTLGFSSFSFGEKAGY